MANYSRIPSDEALIGDEFCNEEIISAPLCNDGIQTEDHLDYRRYAKVLSHHLKQARGPLSIGIFSACGNGKSFLLRLTKELLTTKETKTKTNKLRYVFFGFLSLVVFGLLIAALAHTIEWLQIVAVAVGTVFAILMLLLCATSKSESNGPYWKVLFCAVFSNMPRCITPTNNRKFIHVDFNVWEHGGSHDISVAIVTSVVDRVEKKFGSFTVRLFRSITFKESQIEAQFKGFCCHFWHYGTKVIWVSIAFVVVLLLSLSIGKFDVENNFHLALWTTPTAVGALSAIWAALKIIYALCNSQRARINRALNRTGKSLSEKQDFMKLVKNEVKVVSNFLRSVEYVYDQQYKIVVAIDNLDRVTHDKVRSVLDAVNHLLSDDSSPLFCLIAVNPAVAAKGIDQKYNGNKYLKKFINVPFYLPEINPSIKTYLSSMLENGCEQVRTPQRTWDFFDQTYAFKVTREFLQTDFCIQHILPNPRNIKRIRNVVFMAITFVAFHDPEEMIMDSLSITRKERSMHEESSVQRAIQDYINILKVNGLDKFFNLLGNLQFSNKDGTYAKELLQETLEVCKTYAKFANKADTNVLAAKDAAKRANNAAIQAKESVLVAKKAEIMANQIAQNAKKAKHANAEETTAHCSKQSTSVEATAGACTAKEPKTKKQSSLRFDRFFVKTTTDEKVKENCREAERLAKEVANEAQINMGQAQSAAKEAEDAAERALNAKRSLSSDSVANACEIAEKFAKTAMEARKVAENAANIAFTKASDANSVVENAWNVAAKFAAVNKAKVQDVKKALTKDFCENLTLLIIMIEQWPFLTTLLLQQMNDNLANEQCVNAMNDEHKSLQDVYGEVQLSQMNLGALDEDRQVFERLLVQMEKSNHRLNHTTARNLQKYAINFDPRQVRSFSARDSNVVDQPEQRNVHATSPARKTNKHEVIV